MDRKFRSPKIKAFAEIFVRLWREKSQAGDPSPRVGRMAAMMAGYGATSWCSSNAILTADVMHNKLLKRPDVVEYMRELGLERIGKRWREVGTP